MVATEKLTMTQKWEARMRKSNHRFAMIRTDSAIYDRVAIVKDLARALIVQYPWGKPTRGSVLVRIDSIKQERIERDDILRIRYYTD